MPIEVKGVCALLQVFDMPTSVRCLYFGCPDLDAAYRHLRDKGVNVNEPKVAPYGMKQLYLKDPDGYGLCFQWPAELAP